MTLEQFLLLLGLATAGLLAAYYVKTGRDKEALIAVASLGLLPALYKLLRRGERLNPVPSPLPEPKLESEAIAAPIREKVVDESVERQGDIRSAIDNQPSDSDALADLGNARRRPH